METYTVLVGFTTVRPVIPDQHHSIVLVATDRGPIDAQLVAAQMAATHSVMPTSTEILAVEV
jgi:hypothetical protein